MAINRVQKITGCLLVGASLQGYLIADEALTYNERTVALTILGEARGEGEEGYYQRYRTVSY